MTPREELHANIDELRSLVKSGELNTQQTIERVQVLTDQYVEHTGERPDTGALERMATLILNETYSDKHVDKMAREEYPVMTPDQRKNREKSEVSEVWAQEFDSGRRDRRPQTRDTKRKMRDVTRGHIPDKYARSRNKERRRKYRKFTKRQPVITYYLPEYSR